MKEKIKFKKEQEERTKLDRRIVNLDSRHSGTQVSFFFFFGIFFYKRETHVQKSGDITNIPISQDNQNYQNLATITCTIN